MAATDHTRRVLGMVAVCLLVGTGCTPDATRGRVEHDVTTTFVHSYETSLAMQDKPVVPPKVSSTECHSSLNKTADSGPGSWGCELKYADAEDTRHDDEFVVLVDSLGCYQAFNGAQRDKEIIDQTTHRHVPDPAVGFDGCFNVYNAQTDTAK